MNHPPQDLITTAVRVFEDDAEAKVAAGELLRCMMVPGSTGAEDVVSRWDELDSKPHKPVWKISLFSILGVSILFLLFPAIVGGINWRNALRAVGGLGTIGTPSNTLKAGRPGLTVEHRLLLYGDESKPTQSESSKGLWDRHPENPAYFAQYTSDYLSDHGNLPADFLNTARRIDPNNAWFTYVAAGVVSENAVKKKPRPSGVPKATPPEWEILDEARLDQAAALLREARGQKFCNDYKAQLIRERIPFLNQQDYYRQMLTTGYLAGGTATDTIGLRRLGEIIAVKAQLLGKSKNESEFPQLLEDSNDLARKTLSADSSSLISSLVFRVNITTSFQGLARAAKDLGLTEEAERLQGIYDRLKTSRDAHTKRELMIDGVEFHRKSGIMPAMMIPMVSRQTAELVTISDGELKPVRLMEHELASMVGSLFVFGQLWAAAALVWALRFRQRPVMRKLASRMESLLRPIDWCWITGLGIVAPLLLMMAVNRLTPLGGRDFSISGSHFILPLAQYASLFLLMVIVPVLITRWRLGKRAATLGYGQGGSWLGWCAVFSTVLYIGAVGFSATSNMTLILGSSLLLLPPLLWLIFTASRALLAKSERSLKISTTGQVLVPVYAGGMLVMLWLVPVFHSASQYQFEQDTFMKLDPRYPGSSTYEYKVAAQLQKETRELLGIEP